MSAISMPGGDPAALEQLAAQLETASAGADNLAVNTRRVATDARESAAWTGSAADAYTAFTGNLTTGIGATQAPLAQIAAAVRDYAHYLRVAQQKVSAYSSAIQVAQASGHPADVAAANVAGQDAQLAVAAQQTAGDQAARKVRKATQEMENPFGPGGPVVDRAYPRAVGFPGWRRGDRPLSRQGEKRRGDGRRSEGLR
jgi:hypothetical protein